MKIEKWLDSFKAAWTNKDIISVMDLFSDDIEYWENSYTKLSSIDEVKSEWKAITNQNNITISTSIFSKDDNCFTVLWNLSYTLKDSSNNWAGTYLIKLNPQGKCYYFHQTGEQSN